MAAIKKLTNPLPVFLQLEQQQLAAIDRIATGQKKARSEIIREALTEYLNKARV